MIHVVCKSMLIRGLAPTFRRGFSQNTLIISLRCISSAHSQHSFTVSYLINSLGLLPETALSASKHVRFETQEKPDSVVEFFKSQGFSRVQISNLIRRCPSLLVSNPHKTLLPKLLFFRSKGFSILEVAIMLSTCPFIFKTSLCKQIIPRFDYFQELLRSEEKTIACIKRYTGLLTYDLKTSMVPNIEILREIGVPASNISTLLHYQPRAMVTSPRRFKEIVDEVKALGFSPLRLKFVIAVRALRSLSKTTWERKVSTYTKWGWSQQEFHEAFQRHPGCVVASEDKINGVMDLIVNKLNFSPSLVAKRPGLVTLSLNRRLVPRGSIIKALSSKGLLKKYINLSTFFETPERDFVDKFIMPYKKEASGLLNLYEEKKLLSKC